MDEQGDGFHPTNRRTLLLALGATGVTGLAGCGDDGNGGTDTPTGTDTTTATETTTETDTSTGTDTPTDTPTETESGTATRTTEEIRFPPDPLLSFSGSTVVTPDSTVTLSGTLSNPYLFSVHAIELSVSTPDGWSVSPRGPRTVDPIDTGGDRNISWELTLPEDAEGQSTVTVDVHYESETDTADITVEQTVIVRTGNMPVEGLLAHYPLDGDTPTDASGNGNDATIDGDPDTGVSGAVDGAYALDGAVLELPRFTPSEDSVSVSMWVNVDDLSGDREFFFWGDDPPQFELWYSDGLRFVYYDGSSFGITGGPTLNTGVWVHLAGTYDDSDGTWALYVNGTEVTTLDDPIGPTDTDDVSLTGSNSQIGLHPSVGRQLSGSVDEVRVYDRAISRSEVETLAGESD
jgi:hypothetical protein